MSLISYSNPTGVKQNGKCCDDGATCFSNPCDTRIAGCIKSKLTNNNCNIGQFSTREYVDTNNITFGGTLGYNLMNPLIYSFDNTWTGVVYIKINVDDMDQNSQSDSIDILLDSIHIMPTKNKNSRINLFRTIHGNFSHISYNLSIYCSNNYYGELCNTFCKDTKDQFKCDEKGQKVCAKYWYGLNCSQHCKDQDTDQDGHYYCSSSGYKICLQNWHGSDCKTFCVNGSSYTCDKNGKKVCSAYWYGANCSIYCNPSASNAVHFTCNNDGSKKCDKSWYGTDCNVFCDTNSNGNYTCNNKGEKVCFQNNYGRECNIYCYAQVNDSYICNHAGEKICKQHYFGKSCNVYGKYLFFIHRF